jgi:hypothetical protein
MNTTFRSVDIHAFDVHTLLTPLSSTNSLRPQFRFLTDAPAYHSQYAGGKSVLTSSFDVHPLSKHTQNENHFWKNYLKLFDPKATDYWQLQAPFICSTRAALVRFVADAPNVRGSIRPAIYLSALGWSTNLNIHLAGDITLSALLAFILAALNKPGAKSPAHLELAGQRASFPDIFAFFKNKLLAEVYDPQSPPHDIISKPRHLIISLSQFDGPATYYQRMIGRKGMADADQALLHSLLRGEEIKAKQLAQKLREQPYTVVPFDRRPDFMLIYFEYGALIFMQQSALAKGRRQRALSCFASNARNCAVMIWSLYNFYNVAKAKATTDQTIKGVRDNVLANLRAMGDQYLAAPGITTTSIRYGNALFNNHDKLKQLLA